MQRGKSRMTLAALLFAGICNAALIPAHAGASDTKLEKDLLTIVTDQGKVQFHVELADTPELRRRGLQGRRTLAADAGMLLLFESPRRVRMWMLNTPIPLDMLFIDPQGKITQIAARTTPYSLTPIAAGTPVNGVLEVLGGNAERLGIKPGDRVLHPAFMDVAEPATR
jgi:uncharacterized membrane protein (UPF0127 family)